MRWLSNLLVGFRSLIRKSEVDHDFDEELSGYIEASFAEKLKAGMTPADAHRAALGDLGGSRNAVKHQVWNSRWESSLEGVLQDLRMGFRSLLKSPGFTAIA